MGNIQKSQTVKSAKPARNASQREAGGSVPKNNDNKESLTPNIFSDIV